MAFARAANSAVARRHGDVPVRAVVDVAVFSVLDVTSGLLGEDDDSVVRVDAAGDCATDGEVDTRNRADALSDSAAGSRSLVDRL